MHVKVPRYVTTTDHLQVELCTFAFLWGILEELKGATATDFG
jgi:hypothetical protein